MATFNELKKYIEPEYKLFIGGEWVDAVDKGKYDVFCPSNGEKLATCAKGNEKDVDKAVNAAWKAFPAWGRMPALQRSIILNKIADALDAAADQIRWVERLEVGTMSNGIVTGHFRYSAGVCATNDSVSNHMFDHIFNFVQTEPIGVVGQISPWNAPAGMAVMKLAPALAAGNCIVYRPSSETPISTLIIAQKIAELLPPGVLNVVTGPSDTCGQAILDHPGILKLSFTGSCDTGKRVAASAANKLVPATLELGGKSANIFFDDCNFGQAMTGAYLGLFTMNGEVCVAGSRILVQAGIYDYFVEAFTKMAKGLKVGPVWEDETKIGPMINENHLNKVLKCIEQGKKEGANLLCGGNRLTGGIYDKGAYVEPTLFEGDNSMSIAREEVFGPVGTFIKFRTEAEAIEIANDSSYGLAGGVWSRDIKKALRVARDVRTGNMWVNTYLQLMPGYMFGGYKDSGLGKELHKSAIDSYSLKKSIVINLSETLPV